MPQTQAARHLEDLKTKAYLEPDEVQRLLAAAKNLRDELLIRMLFRSSCRVSELVALRPGDINFTQGTVTIEHLKQRLRLACPDCGAALGRAHHYCPGCGRRVEEAVRKEIEHRRLRTLPLDHETREMLRDYLARYRRAKETVFPIGRRQSWKIVRDCARRAGLPDLVNPEIGRRRGVSPHRLRDAFAVHALRIDDSGDGMRLLQEQLGHASFDTTARYRKVSGVELKNWHDKLWAKKDHEGAAR